MPFNLYNFSFFRLNGCYEALEGGNTAEALIDFTGGVSEPLSLNQEKLIQHADQRKTLFQTLAHAHSHKALITCSIRVRKKEQKLIFFNSVNCKKIAHSSNTYQIFMCFFCTQFVCYCFAASSRRAGRISSGLWTDKGSRIRCDCIKKTLYVRDPEWYV